MSIHRAPDSSVSSITHEKTTVFPVDKVENAGSMSQDETSTTAGAVSPPSEHEPREELWWSRMREYGADFFSEFGGTMVMILFGDGSVAQVTLSDNMKGEYQSISWGWG